MANKNKQRGERKKSAYNLERKSGEETVAKTWIIKAVEWLKEGKSIPYIRECIAHNKKGQVTSATLDKIMAEANMFIADEYNRKNSDAINIALFRYNQEITRLMAIEELPEGEIGKKFSYETWMDSRRRKIQACFDCLQTMAQKEDILQFHNKNFQINYNKTLTVKQVIKEPDFNLDAVTWEELEDFYNLMDKARVDDNEILSVQSVVSEEKQTTEDIQAEIVEGANVEQIKHEVKEIPYVSSLTNADPTKKLRQSLAKIAAKTMKAKGGNLDQYEERLLEE